MEHRNLHLTAIAGGIGSGKSVVCRILEAMGYAVYDCDTRAKALMDNSDEIKAAIAGEICSDAIVCKADGRRAIDRKTLASAVFGDPGLLAGLNRLVHGAVRADIRCWKAHIATSGAYGGKRVFVETAILYESGLHELVDEVWEVCAPDEVRLARAMARDISPREQILARMSSQRKTSADALASLKMTGQELPPCRSIVNDGNMPLLPQILQLLGR